MREVSDHCAVLNLAESEVVAVGAHLADERDAEIGLCIEWAKSKEGPVEPFVDSVNFCPDVETRLRTTKPVEFCLVIVTGVPS